MNHNIDTESASTEIFKGFQIVGRHRKQRRKTARKDLATELSLFRCCAVFEHLDMPDMSVSANWSRATEISFGVAVYILSREES